MTCPSGTWVDTHDVLPSRAMQKSLYYTDFMCRHRMRQIIGVVLAELHSPTAMHRQENSVNSRTSIHESLAAE